MQITVARPAAWIHVPLDRLDASSDPSRDEQPRYRRPLRWGWRTIAIVATAAVDAARASTSDPWASEVAVEVRGPRLASRRYKVEEWMFDGPVLEPPSPDLVNGRHRLWGARAAGLTTAPGLAQHLDWAIAAWTAEDGSMSLPDRSSIDSLAESGEWWASAEAEPWRSINPGVIVTLGTVIDGWRGRLSS